MAYRWSSTYSRGLLQLGTPCYCKPVGCFWNAAVFCVGWHIRAPDHIAYTTVIHWLATQWAQVSCFCQSDRQFWFVHPKTPYWIWIHKNRAIQSKLCKNGLLEQQLFRKPRWIASHDTCSTSSTSGDKGSTHSSFAVQVTVWLSNPRNVFDGFHLEHECLAVFGIIHWVTGRKLNRTEATLWTVRKPDWVRQHCHNRSLLWPCCTESLHGVCVLLFRTKKRWLDRACHAARWNRGWGGKSPCR